MTRSKSVTGWSPAVGAYIERNTYRFYQCNDDQPDFTLPIQVQIGGTGVSDL
jgi:hypothetical protein